MQLSHTRPVASAVFDDPNLVSCAGLVPMAALAGQCGLAALADEHLSVPTDKGSNSGAKVACLVAGMVAGADSIDDMALLRHGAMGTVFDRPYAPSTLGSFLRAFTFGHVRQLDAVASRFLAGLHARTPLLAGIDGPILVDLDDTIIEVHGYAKQGSGYGYTRVRGLNALIATLTTTAGAPVITGARLRKGSCGSPRGAKRIIADTLATVNRLRSPEATGKPLLRADSAFYGHPTIAAALRGGAEVSITVRMDTKVKTAIAQIPDDAWTPIEYTDAIYDEPTKRWISRAEVAEIGFTAFSSKKASQQVPGRLVVRRIPDLNTTGSDGQQTLFDTWRFHAFFTTTDLDTVTADKTHRGHAIIEQVHADLKNSALAHLPSGKFTANAAWLVMATMAFNLTRAAATLTRGPLAKARTATIRRTLISVPARIASSARRLTLHLPRDWPWEHAWNTLFGSLSHQNRPIIA
ncbi:IS1380 family transposase [Mycobacterium sp. SMC-8]|uniref:IS1380 family transposase n=1 Tax=Mycobacterium sp. SMC-8 TaxID=2857060 RepID=UPI0021B3FFA1|nr:IS1380 family transposase [Mycobacterium sp. SMC-8]UXA11725.1 IS1380 family transposase [Mycobacterium sp. SMC-8]